jgi:hydrogenase maturation protease
MKILVAGIGNVLLGDDGFGVEVARRLAAKPLPDGVKVRDFGIRGMDLAYALLDGYDAAVLVDIARRGGPPGTLYVIEPVADEDGAPSDANPEPHSMHPARVMAFVEALGGTPAPLRLVACEPVEMDEDELVMGLSAPVAAAVEPAAALVESVVLSLHAAFSQGADQGEASEVLHA